MAITRTTVGRLAAEDFSMLAVGVQPTGWTEWEAAAGIATVEAAPARSNFADNSLKVDLSGDGAYALTRDEHVLTDGVVQAFVAMTGGSTTEYNTRPGLTFRHTNNNEAIQCWLSYWTGDAPEGLHLAEHTGGVTRKATVARAIGKETSYVLQLEVSGTDAIARLFDYNFVLLDTISLANLTKSTAGPAGVYLISMNTNDAWWDQWRLCTGRRVAVGGLPTGWKARIDGITAAEAGGTATIDLVGKVLPVLSNVEVLDAAGVVQETFTPPEGGYVWGGDQYTYESPVKPVVGQWVTIFGDDDTTPLVGTVDAATGLVVDPTASTDPTHARPYLQPMAGAPRRGVELLQGKAHIGQAVCELLDKRAVAGDQDTGWLTALLPDNAGRTALQGRRLLWEAGDTTGTRWTLFDGVIRGANLAFEELTVFRLTLRDFRERLRKMTCFNWTDSMQVYPPGLVEGWGGRHYAHDFGWQYFINPQQYATGTFMATGPRAGYVNARWWVKGTDAFLQALAPTDIYSKDGTTAIIEYGNHVVEWRLAGSEAWVVYERPTIAVPGAWMRSTSGGRYNPLTMQHRNELMEFVGIGDDGEVITHYPYIGTMDQAQWPADGAEVEIRIRWRGPATEFTPQHLYGPFNEVIPRILDGYYYRDEQGNPIPARIPYDQAAFDKFAHYTVVGRITKPVGVDKADGYRALLGWLEKHAFKPLGLAPALNERGELAPISFDMPEDVTGIPQLDDTNVESMDWEDSSETVINRVELKHKRYTRYADIANRARLRSEPAVVAGLDGIVVEDAVLVVEENALLPTVSASMLLLGENTLEVETDLFGPDISGGANLMEAGDLADPERIGVRLAYAAFDRYLLGGQLLSGVVSRSLGLDVGDWAIVAVSWLPDYRTGLRGMARLAQVTDVAPLDDTLAAVELVDAGPNHAPAPQPTLGVVSIDAGNGVPSVAVATIPQLAGWEHPIMARVEYAISLGEPASQSAAWQFMGRYENVGTYYGPRNPPGNLWLRVRGEAPATVPSPWTVYGPYVVPERAALVDMAAEVDPATGVLTVSWEGIFGTASVLLEAVQHADGEDPNFALPDITRHDNASPHVFTHAEVTAKAQFTVQATPYTGWTGTEVAGTPGRPWRITIRKGQVVDAVRWPSTSLSAVFEQTDPQGNSALYAQGVAGYWTAGVLLRLWAQDGTLLIEETAYADPLQSAVGEKSKWTHRLVLEPGWGDQILRLEAVPTREASLHGDAGGLEGAPVEVAIYIAAMDINEPVRSFTTGPSVGRYAEGMQTGTGCDNLLEPGFGWEIAGMRPGDTVSVERNTDPLNVPSGINDMAELNIGHVPGPSTLAGAEWVDRHPETFNVAVYVVGAGEGGAGNQWDYTIRVRNAAGTVVLQQNTNVFSAYLKECAPPAWTSFAATLPAEADNTVALALDADQTNADYEYRISAVTTLNDEVNTFTDNHGNITASLYPALPSTVQDAVQNTNWDSPYTRNDLGGTIVTTKFTAELVRTVDGVVSATATSTVSYHSNAPVPA